MRPPLARLALVSTMLLACNSPAPEGAKKDAPVAAVPTPETSKTPPADIKAQDPAPDAKTSEGPAADAKAPEDPAADAKAPEDPAADAKAPEDPANPPADAKAEPAADPATPPAADPAAAAEEAKKKLLTEAKAKKTTDAKAKKALEDAEKAGATPRELAEAANARGEALFDDPERAAAFFTWAKDKDPTYPNPVFNLAKQSANAGEIPQTVALLKEVQKRGGKTLLKQIDFDPTFEIVKDDAEVQKLSK